MQCLNLASVTILSFNSSSRLDFDAVAARLSVHLIAGKVLYAGNGVPLFAYAAASDHGFCETSRGADNLMRPDEQGAQL